MMHGSTLKTNNGENYGLRSGDMVKSMNHVGLSVKNLEESVNFYTEVMGMEVDYRAYHEGEAISDVVGVENATLDICVVRKGNCSIELIEYNNRVEAKGHKKQNEPGLVHISFAVESVEEMYERIRTLGYDFYSKPMVTRPNGPKICYFKGPDSVTMELYEKQ
jgi:catechol 2,3-dioxygenase-like lactoylglutathione lyase family enzyme